MIISAPSNDADAMIVPGVNEEISQPESYQVVSMASCTRDYLSPVAKLPDESFGVSPGGLRGVKAHPHRPRPPAAGRFCDLFPRLFQPDRVPSGHGDRNPGRVPAPGEPSGSPGR